MIRHMEGCIMNIKEQLKKVRESIADYPDVRIVVATKYITSQGKNSSRVSLRYMKKGCFLIVLLY